MQPYDDGFLHDSDRAPWRHRRRFSLPPELSGMLGCPHPTPPSARVARDADEERRARLRTMRAATLIAIELALALDPHQRRRHD